MPKYFRDICVMTVPTSFAEGGFMRLYYLRRLVVPP